MSSAESPLVPPSATAPRGGSVDDAFADSEVAIEVRELRKRYGARAVVNGVSFRIRRGERVALMGPSGSGKSTLLNCVGGIDRGDLGSIHIAGVDLSTLDSPGLTRLRRDRIGTVFQFFHLLPTLTARENIELPLQLLGVPHAERRERVETLIRQVKLEHRADAFPDAISGGEMQRVAIARALSTRPAVILADEPTGNLDSHTGDAILDLLAELTDTYRIAMLLVTHSEEATRICHRVLHMRDGVMAEAGATEASTP